MRRMKSEIEGEVPPNDQTASQFNDEGNGGSTNGVVLKKGPWTAAEDAILVDYVKKYGQGNWNAVQKHSGLSRCGKSCRLRWANHLRPDLKKGAFTAEEERLIAQLHSKMGNKWARMAVHLPGRTDNEIKNYWNTRVKRRLRANQPLYSPELCLQESQHGQSTGGIIDDNNLNHDILHKNNYVMHDPPIYDSQQDNQGVLTYMPEPPHISPYNNVLNYLNSSHYCNFAPSTSPDHKRLRQSTMPFLDSSGLNRNGFYLLEHIQGNTSDEIAPSFGMQSTFDAGPSSHSSICYSHSHSNGNSSTSKPTTEAVKLELPSLQYPEIDLGSWGTSPTPPLLESVDDFIQSPTPISALHSDCSSPQNSGTLDAVLYQALSCSRNHHSDKGSNSSTATPGDRVDSSTLNMHETEWKNYADPVSPFGATSILNEGPAVSANANSLDELPIFNGNIDILDFDLDRIWNPNSGNQPMSLFNNTLPDCLLDSGWLEPGSGLGMNQAFTTDAISTLLGDDLSNDYKHMTAGTSERSQVWGFGSSARNNMPAIGQVSDRG